MSVAAFDELRLALEEEADLARRVEALLAALAQRMAATSNDQNVQKLARELRAASPQLAAAVRGAAA